MPYFFTAAITFSMLLVCNASAKCEVAAIFVQPPHEVPETAILVVNEKFVDIALPRRNLSSSVTLDSVQTAISVLTERPAKLEIPFTAPKFTIPETWTRCILLFFHDPANKVFPARIIPVNASSADFPMGHVLMFNVSTASVSAKLGTEAVKILPGKSVNVRPPRTGSGSYQVAIDCILPGEKLPIALCRSTWQHEANARQILFIVPQPEQKIPSIWGVLDREEARDTNTP
jgi:hypothetical protein